MPTSTSKRSKDGHMERLTECVVPGGGASSFVQLYSLEGCQSTSSIPRINMRRYTGAGKMFRSSGSRLSSITIDPS